MKKYILIALVTMGVIGTSAAIAQDMSGPKANKKEEKMDKKEEKGAKKYARGSERKAAKKTEKAQKKAGKTELKDESGK